MSVRAALAGILLLASALRLAGLSPHPDGFQPDEVANGYDAFALALTGADHHGNHLPLLFESYGDWASPLLTYLTVPFVALGGLSAATIRLPGVIANVVAVWAVYLVAKELAASEIAGLAAALALATSPWDIALAQFAAPPTLLPLLAALAVLYALRSIRRRSLRDATLFAASCALLVYDYPTQKLFAPLFVFVAIVAMRGWAERIRAGIVFCVLVLPIFILTFSDPKYNARFAYVGLNPHAPSFLGDVLQRYGEYLNPLFFARGDLGLSLGLLLFLWAGFAALLGAALWPALGKKAWPFPFAERRQAAVVLLFLLLAPFPASLTIDHLHLNRSAHMLSIAVATMGYGFVFAIAPLRRRTTAFAVLVLVAYCAGSALLIASRTAEFAGRYYHGRHLITGFAERQDGLGTALVAVAQRAAGAPIVVDSGAFNQAYMYYLVAARYDPRRLPLVQMRDSEEPGSWAYVSALDNFRFRPVSPEELAQTAEDTRLQFDDVAAFDIRRNGGTYYLERAQAAPSVP